MGNPVRRKLAVATALAAVTALAACSSNASEGAGETGNAIDGGSLTVVTPTEPVTMNPIQSVISDARVWGSMLDPLVDVDEQGVPLDTGLIDSWEQVDPTTWEFTVREGVTFHNDEPLDAEAVAFVLEQNQTDPAAKLATYMSVVDSVEVTGDHSLTITTNEPYNALPLLLSVIYPVAPEYYETEGAEGFAKAPVGTGAFEFDSYQAGQQVVVTRNSDYWRGEPQLEEITFTWAPDPSSRVSLLQTGGADVAIDVPVEQAPSVESAGLQLESKQTTASMAVFFETAKAPFDDPDLRRAVSMAIDRDAIVSTLFGGDGAVTQQHLIGQLMSETPEHADAIAYDPEGAKALLDGRSPEIEFSYTVGRYPQDSKVGEAVSGMLETAGFKVKRNPLDVAKFFELRPQGAFEMYMYQIAPVFLHPDVYVHGFLTSNSITHHCVDPKIDEMSSEALSATSPEESEATYAEIEAYALHETVCNVPMYDVVGFYGLSKRVVGFEAPRNQLPNWFEVGVSS